MERIAAFLRGTTSPFFGGIVQPPASNHAVRTGAAIFCFPGHSDRSGSREKRQAGPVITSHLPAVSDCPGGGPLTPEDQSHSWRFALFLFPQRAVSGGCKLPCESMIFRWPGSQSYGEGQFYSRKSPCTREDTSTAKSRG